MMRAMSKTTPPVQLRIELRWVRPRVWRRVLVPASMQLARLHRVIQAAMGWSDSHLHEFVIDQQRYGQADPQWDAPGDVIAERKATVASLQAATSALYTYDFGDGWEHEIKVEAALAKYLDLKAPVCVEGKNACPPEDCGGPPGYEELLRIMADPGDPEHDAMIEWAGRVWDATEFDLDAVNRELSRLR
jgi:hypothetical protein